MTQDSPTTTETDDIEPVVSVTEDNIHIEWHAHGLNIELRVRAHWAPWALVEDVRGEVTSFVGQDDAVTQTIKALQVMQARHDG